jgi:CoA:oxalate CoA-transferase
VGENHQRREDCDELNGERQMSAIASGGPLDGVRVLDFTNMLSGPYCTRLLADMGAEIIKVEPPTGDHNRHRRPVRNGHSSFFGHLNCGKKSVILDLKCDAGRAAALGLAAKSDVLVENWRPGVAARLGFGYEAIAGVNPRIVYCSISGFGQKGPNAQRAAYAPILHAASGYDLAHVSYQGGGRPPNSAAYIADILGGMSAFAAIQTALLHRHQSGRGQYIDLALMDCMLNLMINEFQESQAPSNVKLRVYQPLQTSDGYIAAAPTSQRNFEQLAVAVGHAEWLSDLRFAKTSTRETHWSEFMNAIEQWTQGKTSQECERVLLEAGVPCTRYKTVAEAMADPHIAQRGALARVKDGAGEYWVPNAPFQMPGLKTNARSHVPTLGEHTLEVLNSLLGYLPSQAHACQGEAKPEH